MKQIVFLFSIIVCILTFQVTQFEAGNEASVHWAPQAYHILHSATQVPRSVDVTIKYKTKFPKSPKVAISNYALDWSAGSPAGYLINIISVNEEGFVIRYTAVSPKQFYGIYCYWLAIFDPRIHVQWFESTETGAIKQGEGKRDVSFDIPLQDFTFDQPPIAAAFLTGVKFTKNNWLIFSEIVSITDKKVTLKVNTWGTTNIEVVKFCLIFGTQEALYSTGNNGFQIPNSSHFWRVFSQPSDRSVDMSVDIPKIWQSGDRVPLIGFTGYDTDETKNQRLYLRNFQLGNEKSTLQIGTWWDSVIYQISFQIVIYKPDLGMKILDKNCAELFTECSFQGESISICDKIDSLPEKGWAKPIKSLTVPKQRALKLYNSEGLKGEVVTFVTDQNCIEDMKFSFAQLMIN